MPRWGWIPAGSCRCGKEWKALVSFEWVVICSGLGLRISLGPTVEKGMGAGETGRPGMKPKPLVALVRASISKGPDEVEVRDGRNGQVGSILVTDPADSRWIKSGR